MKAYIFPGQGSQFVGMGKDLYESAAIAKMLFDQANEILGFSITDVMFEGAEEDLKQTKITQPAIFLHSIAKAQMAGDSFQPDAVAGHSLGEFSALVASKALSFEAALVLVYKRAMAMQKACEIQPSTMAAVLGLADDKVEEICASITDDLVVPANYNCPGQLVISGTISGVEKAVALCKEAGALKAVLL
ncbi:MAG TPA: ACP S-malonyltransferase, partial [Haliscomenobacter sp.]|nr:ACP S-malonyltransferase [Haliscomenobacter sp.]